MTDTRHSMMPQLVLAGFVQRLARRRDEDERDSTADDQEPTSPVGRTQHLTEDGKAVEGGNDHRQIRECADPSGIGLLISHRDANLTAARTDADSDECGSHLPTQLR